MVTDTSVSPVKGSIPFSRARRVPVCGHATVTPVSPPPATPASGANRRIRHHPPANSDSCSTGCHICAERDVVAAAGSCGAQSACVRFGPWDLCPCPAPGPGTTPRRKAGRALPRAHSITCFTGFNSRENKVTKDQKTKACVLEGMRSLNDPRRGSLWGSTGTGCCRESARLFGSQALTVKPVTPLSSPPRHLQAKPMHPSPSAQEFRLLLNGLATSELRRMFCSCRQLGALSVRLT
jgi:hypothetical protein